MADAYLDHLSYCLGDDVVSVESACAAGRTISDAETLRQAGFTQHHVSRNGGNVYDLAYRAVDKIKESLQDVGAIVYSTCLPQNGRIDGSDKYRSTKDVKHLMNFTARHLQ